MSFTVYKSSAGSGKTFTLVKEYLKLALSDEQNPPRNFRKILAITFTNKAAAEMKERIVSSLKLLSDQTSSVKNTGMFVALQEELNLPPHIISERAGKVLEAILHSYSDFAIGTIDSFVHKVIRTFAFDLKIPINFNIETDSNKLIAEAVDILISRIGSDEKLTKVLVDFVESKTDNEKTRHIEYDLQKLAHNLLKEESISHIKKLGDLTIDDFLSIQSTIIKEIKNFESSIKQVAAQAHNLITKKNIPHSSFYRGETGIATYFKRISEGKLDKLEPNSYVISTIDEDKWISGKASKTDKEIIEDIKSELIETYGMLQNIIKENYPEYVLFSQIHKNIYALTVLNEIEKILEDFKRENNILHISEFNKLISGIVATQPVPFIYERLGEKYNNYLIDEFQDTSVLQWHNLLPLIDNSLAEDHFTMLVGDGKQAIYRWRGGEVEQFTNLPEVAGGGNELVKERAVSLKRSFAGKNLSKNFRSKREIIEFNNSFFKTLSAELPPRYQQIYAGQEQEFDPENTGGYVSVELFSGDKQERKEQYLQRITEIIKSLLEEGFLYSEIAILIRKNSDGNDIANRLSSLGIPVISSDSLLLKKSREVNFIFALLKSINDPGDNISKAAILEYLVLNEKIKGSLHENISEVILSQKHSALDVFLKAGNIAFNSSYLITLSLYEMAEELIGLFELNKNKDIYTQFLLNEVLTYSTKINNNLPDFIEWWSQESYQPSIAIPEGLNAVSVMTIHRSKGLEFPVVIFPFADWHVDYGNKQLWINPNNKKISKLESAIVSTTSQLENTEFSELYAEEKNKSLLDNLNVLYVALTRPEERMYILSASPGKTPANLNYVNDMIAYYLQQNEAWNENKNAYEFGLCKKRANKINTAKANTYEPKVLNSTSPKENIRIKTSASEIWGSEEIEQKKSKGILLHRILSKIKTAEQAEEVLKAFYNEGIIDDEELADLSVLIDDLLEVPEINLFFEKGLIIKTEAELLLPGGSIFRPDRVIIYKDKAVVIDFKTGKSNLSHKEQLNQYSEILTGMGYPKVEKYLIYIEERKVEKV